MLKYTLTELSQHTHKIMAAVHESRTSVYITNHGRIVAVIQHLDTEKIENQVLEEVARNFGASHARR